MWIKKLINYLRLFIVLLTLAGCSTNSDLPVVNPNLIDRSFLTDQPCQSPCWYGLQPGVSTEDEVFATVRNLTFVKQDQILTSSYKFDRNLPGFLTTLYYKEADKSIKDESGPSLGNFIISDHTLVQIELWPYFKLSFKQAAEKLGDPDYFAIVPQYGPDGGRECRVFMLWKKGIKVAHYDKPELFFQKDTCDKVPSVDGHLPSSLSIDKIYYESNLAVEAEMNLYEFQKWNGFAN
jgi:hypothetical protein